MEQTRIGEFFPKAKRRSSNRLGKKRRHPDISEAEKPTTFPGPPQCKNRRVSLPCNGHTSATVPQATGLPLPVKVKSPTQSPVKLKTPLAVKSPIQSPVKTPLSSPVKLRCPGTPEQFSRGRMMVALARQKVAGSPTGRDQTGSSCGVRHDKRRVTSRRRLYDFYADEVSEDKQEKPKIQQFGYLEFNSPTKSSDPPPSSRACALELSEQHLPLPTKYRLLAERFRCVDTVATMLHKRDEACTFSKLKKAVQEMTKRQFDECHLGQIKAILPLAFVFRQEEVSRRVYQLTVEPNLQAPDLKATSSSQMSSNLVHRHRLFNKKLCNVVRTHHQEFLANLDPPLSIPEDEVRRWHPKFLLEMVPDIVPLELPPPPFRTEAVGASVSAKDVLSKMPVSTMEKLESVTIAASSSDIKDNPMLKGVSADLVNKIRAKEASMAKATITRDTQTQQKLQMLGDFPDVIRIIRNYFTSERKTAIVLEEVTKKIVESRSGLAQDRMEDYIRYLGEVCKGWMTFPVVRKKNYLKINKNIQVKELLSKIEYQQKKLLKGS